MTEQDLSTLFHDRLPEMEPPMALDADRAIQQGRRARRVRRAIAGGVAGLAVAGVAVVAWGLADDDTSTQVAADPGAAPIDQAVLDVVDREFAPHLGALPATEVTATDADGRPVPLDSAAVAGVGILYELDGDRDVSLGVHEAEATAITDCTQWEADRTARSCEVTTLADGTTVMTHVLAFGPAEAGGPALPTILTDDALAAADPATLTWSHGILVLTPDGDFVGAYEVAPAPSLDAARAAWLLPDEALVAAATASELTGHDFD